jgi:hypothetical protein
MQILDRKTTIQVSASTRDRLYLYKFRKTYDEYINYLLDVIDKLEEEGRRRERDPEKMRHMAEMTREWVKRNVKFKNGRIKEIDINGK